MLEEMSTAQYLSFGILKDGVNETWEINWYLTLYYVVCILIGVNVVGSLYKRDQPIAAIMSILLLLMIFIFFGLRWFGTPDPKGSSKCPDPNNTNAQSGRKCPTFPPSINLCPDFMVAYTEPTGRVLCYDVNNTYEMKKASGAALMTGLTINGVGGQSAHTAGLELVNTIKSSPTTITGDPNGKYLRWEGVFDGRTIEPDVSCITSKLAA